jgi:hypothetical protein
MSEDSRWFEIWDTIFPHIVRPSSAFYTGERDVAVCAFRKFWRENGEQLVTDFLKTRACQSYSMEIEETTLQTIYDLVEEDVVDRILDDSGEEKGRR